jgi:hypothetical protein
MNDRVSIDFNAARTAVEDGAVAVRRNESENANHFSKEALAALDGVPTELPYVRSYRDAVENLNFETALDELANFAAYIREYDEDDYTFSYQESALDRVEESAK